jgi:hypothetical protein
MGEEPAQREAVAGKVHELSAAHVSVSLVVEPLNGHEDEADPVRRRVKHDESLLHVVGLSADPAPARAKDHAREQLWTRERRDVEERHCELEGLTGLVRVAECQEPVAARLDEV